MIKVKLSPACRRPLSLIQYTVETLLTDDFYTTTVMSVGRILTQCSDDLLTHGGLPQHHTTVTVLNQCSDDLLTHGGLPQHHTSHSTDPVQR